MKKPLIQKIYEAINQNPEFNSAQIGFVCGVTASSVTDCMGKHGETFSVAKAKEIRRLKDLEVMYLQHVQTSPVNPDCVLEGVDS